jgi:hypothetical protein
MLNPEDKVTLMPMIVEEVTRVAEQLIPANLQNKIADIKKEIKEQTDQYLKTTIIAHVSEIVDKVVNEELRDHLFKVGGDIAREVDELKIKLMQYRSFAVLDAHVKKQTEFSRVVSEVVIGLRQLKLKMDALEGANVKTLAPPIILDSHLKRMFVESKLSLMEVQNHFKVSFAQANNYVNGKVKDPTIRASIFLFLQSSKDLSLHKGV